MLGLGSGIHLAQRPGLRLVATYTSDFTSGADGWAAHNVEGTLTLEAWENAPGHSSDDWLKGTFDTNQTHSSDLKKFTTLNIEVGDYWEVSWKIYLDNPSGGDFWDDGTYSDPGAEHDMTAVLGNIGNTGEFDIPQEEVYSAASSIRGPVTNASSGHAAHIRFTSNTDLPLAGAVFYIKDIVWKHYSAN